MNTEQYLVLFPRASREKARFMALAEAVLRQAVDLMALIESFSQGFRLPRRRENSWTQSRQRWA